MENIALAFSGGGFRAACFSLGCLSYLDKIKYGNDKTPLLQNVKYISSTSGGSITNLVYTFNLYKGKDFAQSYSFLLNQLSGETMISRALTILESSSEWQERPFKSRNIINAFSLAYDELFAKETFGLYSNPSNNPHIEEICVNATEFTNGQAFRFQSQRPGISNGKIGNGYIFFTDDGKDEAAQLKLADILASSSCFPSGFEPLIFPNDYSYGQLTPEQLNGAIRYKANEFTLPPDVKEYNSYDLLKDKKFEESQCFGIMDGGVTDNQAIEAFKMADKRRTDNDKPGFDLFVACDVTSYFMDGYTLPMEKKKWYSRLSVNRIILLWLLFSLVFPALLLWVRPWQGWTYVAGTVSGLMLLPVLYMIWKKIKALFSRKKDDTSWGKVFNKYKNIFFRLRLGALEQMLLSRIKSVFVLANDIYLKQIRRMYYEGLFGEDKFRSRIVQNAIYDLSKAKFPSTDPSKPLQPSAVMIAMAEKARTMGTTLWFDENHRAQRMKECTIATGHFTTCYNLLKFFNKKEEEKLNSEIKELKKNLEADWKRFCTATDEVGLLKECGC